MASTLVAASNLIATLFSKKCSSRAVENAKSQSLDTRADPDEAQQQSYPHTETHNLASLVLARGIFARFRTTGVALSAAFGLRFARYADSARRPGSGKGSGLGQRAEGSLGEPLLSSSPTTDGAIGSTSFLAFAWRLNYEPVRSVFCCT